MLGQLAWQKEPDSSLDLPRGKGFLFVVLDEAGGLACQPLEQIKNKRVENAHGLLGDSRVWMNLLENTIDVHIKGFPVGFLEGLTILLQPSWLLDSFANNCRSSDGGGVFLRRHGPYR